MLVMGIMMVSNLPMPKLGRLRSTKLTAALFICVFVGYGLGFAKVMPELFAWMPVSWLLVCVAWGVLSEEARNLKPPPMLAQGSGGTGAAFIEGEDEEDEDEDPLVEIEQMGR
jgi:hypothetical protein